MPAAPGRVHGVDVSAPLLERARELTVAERLDNASYEQGDAQVHPFAPGRYDVAISRFGAMFFSDPVAAFGNIARAGFCHIRFADVREPVFYGRDSAAALAFVRGFQTVSDTLASLAPADAARALERLRDVLDDHDTGGDGVVFDSRAWIVSAQRC